MPLMKPICTASARLPADRYDLVGGLVCLAGVAIIMYAPR